MDHASARPTTSSMTMHPGCQQPARSLIDGLKAFRASNGLGSEGSEYKIIVRRFYSHCCATNLPAK
jgi:type I restriction enzyme M protein